MQEYYTLVTDYGRKKELDCISNNTSFDIQEIAVGDGNGSNYEPEKSQTALKNECWRGVVTRCENETSKDENGNIIEGARYAVVDIPANVGGFTIREVGAFDKAGNLLMIAKTAPNEKKSVETGDIKQLSYRFDLSILNELVLPFIIDPSINTASTKYVEKHFQALNEKGENNGYAPLNNAAKLPLLHTTDFNKFCVNTGTYDENNMPDLLQYSETLVFDEENSAEIPEKIKTKGTFTYTEAGGLTHFVNEVLTLNVTDFENGTYNICVQEEDGIFSLCVGTPELDLNNPPYLAYENGELSNKVPVGILELSGGG